MSSATTIHDGCGSLVHLLLLCIILILSMSISYTASTYAALSYIGCTLLWKEIQLDAKVRKIVGLRVKFYHFL